MFFRQSFALRFLPVLAAGCPLALVVGCGFTPALQTSAGSSALALRGQVHGGQQPVAGAQIQLFQVGKAGNFSAASGLLTSSVQTAADGSFGMTGDYTCPDANAPVYVVSSGGDPGIGSANPAAVMVAALGSCGDLLANGNNTYINLNEVTTVAAAWALGSFASDAAHVGASSTNTAGIATAFANAALLADTATGIAATSTASRLVQTGKIYSLANALAACVNSAAGSMPCHLLFAAATPAGGTAPADTFTAALQIAQNPGLNVADVFDLAPATPAFGGGLVTAPHDWSMSTTIVPPTGACFGMLARDSAGVSWVPDTCGNQIYAFDAMGTPVSGSPFGSSVVNQPSAVVASPNGDIWVANTGTPGGALPVPTAQQGYLLRFAGSNAGSPGTVINSSNGTPYFMANTVASSAGLAMRANGNILATNASGLQAVSEYDSSGTLLSTTTGPATLLAGIPDTSGGLWYLYSSFLTAGAEHFAQGNYAVPAVPSCCAETPYVAVTDSNGTLWGLNGSALSAITNANTVLIDSQTVPGLYSAVALTVDAGGVVWPLSNLSASGTAPVAFTAVSTATGASGPGSNPAGTVLSPASGFGLDANLQNPLAISPDAAGDLWIVDSTAGLVEFFGMATPTAMPLLPVPVAP